MSWDVAELKKVLLNPDSLTTEELSDACSHANSRWPRERFQRQIEMRKEAEKNALKIQDSLKNVCLQMPIIYEVDDYENIRAGIQFLKSACGLLTAGGDGDRLKSSLKDFEASKNRATKESRARLCKASFPLFEISKHSCLSLNFTLLVSLEIAIVVSTGPANSENSDVLRWYLRNSDCAILEQGENLHFSKDLKIAYDKEKKRIVTNPDETGGALMKFKEIKKESTHVLIMQGTALVDPKVVGKVGYLASLGHDLVCCGTFTDGPFGRIVTANGKTQIVEKMNTNAEIEEFRDHGRPFPRNLGIYCVKRELLDTLNLPLYLTPEKNLLTLEKSPKFGYAATDIFDPVRDACVLDTSPDEIRVLKDARDIEKLRRFAFQHYQPLTAYSHLPPEFRNLLQSLPQPTLKYGTSGLRTRAELLDSALFRVVYLLVRISKKCGHSVGLMITASHNPAEDNGFKAVNPDGEMFDEEFEDFANTIINCPVDEIPPLTDLSVGQKITEARIVVGRDTRESSERLEREVIRVLEMLNVYENQIESLNVCTTPFLHYITAYENNLYLNEGRYCATPYDYLNKLVNNFKFFDVRVWRKLICDCSNGTAYQGLKDFKQRGLEYLELVNCEGVVNLNCGADYVKMENRPGPEELRLSWEDEDELFGFSYDGDADRLVAFSKLDSSFFVYDGDRIAILFLRFVQKHVRIMQLRSNVSIALIQTPYANGASTEYVRKNFPEVRIVKSKTGIRHLMRKAKRFDVSVYFEPNGHGSCYFSTPLMRRVFKIDRDTQLPVQRAAAKRFRRFRDGINEIVGDAMSDMLACLICLQDLSEEQGKQEIDAESIRLWRDLYHDLPSSHTKFFVQDKSRYLTVQEGDGSRLAEPKQVQQQIDEICKRHQCRAFIRPSGTENFLRIYVESHDTVDEVVPLLENVVRQYENS